MALKKANVYMIGKAFVHILFFFLSLFIFFFVIFIERARERENKRRVWVRFGWPTIKPTSSNLLSSLCFRRLRIFFFLLFLGRIEFGRWCMDPNDRLWPEKSLGLTLSVDLRAFWQGNADIYDTD